MNHSPEMMRDRRVHWPRVRFSLRTFLMICVLPVPFLAWLANAKFNAVQQRAAIAYFLDRGFEVGAEEVLPAPSGVLHEMSLLIDRELWLRIAHLSGSKPIQAGDIEKLERLQGLRTVHLDGNRAGPRAAELELGDREVRRIVGIKSLTNLRLNARIEIESLRGLATLPKLAGFSLPKVKLDANFLEALSANPQLTAIEFNGSALDSAAASKLAKFPALQTLVLYDPSPAALTGLAECRQLRILGLFEARLTAADAEAIHSLQIQSLDLVDVTIDAGFFRRLQSHPTLTHLTIQSDGKYFSTPVSAQRDGPITLAALEYCEDHFTTDEKR